MSLLCNDELLGTFSVPAQRKFPNALDKNLSKVWISGIQAHSCFIFFIRIMMDAQDQSQIIVLCNSCFLTDSFLNEKWLFFASVIMNLS